MSNARIISFKGELLAREPCAAHCSNCEGMDHHWMPDCDELTGMPIMVCKHCDAQREMTDEDFES